MYWFLCIGKWEATQLCNGMFTLGLEASCDFSQHTDNHFQGGIEREQGYESLEKFTTSTERRKSCYNPFKLQKVITKNNIQNTSCEL